MARVQVDDTAPPLLGGVDRGPTRNSLQTGEKVVQNSSKLLSRRGRGNICFRVYGDNATGWAEAAALWGGDGRAYRAQDT